MRWGERRDARQAAGGPLWIVREVPAAVTSNRHPRAGLDASAERDALGFRDLHIHLDGVPAASQAGVIRQAIDVSTDRG